MSTTLHVPEDLAARLAVEARRRGVDVDALSAELLSAGLADEVADNELEAFIGVGRSGRSDLGRRHRAIKAELVGDRSARDL
jgi:hypothetical protein